MDRIQLRALLAEIFTDVTGEDFSSLRDEQILKDDLQLDSLDLVSIAVGVQDRLSVNIEAAEVNDIVTVGDLVGLLQAKRTPSKPANAA
jgi:acyl carrier protein